MHELYKTCNNLIIKLGKEETNIYILLHVLCGACPNVHIYHGRGSLKHKHYLPLLHGTEL